MPQTISEEHKQDAWALSATTANLAILVGPALGTALVLGLGAGEAFAFDAATFVLSAVLLARVRPRIRIAAAAPPPRQSLVAELRAGFQRGRLAAVGVRSRSPPSPGPCSAATRSSTRWRR